MRLYFFYLEIQNIKTSEISCSFFFQFSEILSFLSSEILLKLFSSQLEVTS